MPERARRGLAETDGVLGAARLARGPALQALSLHCCWTIVAASTTRFWISTGGERGIRTLEGLLTLTPLAGVRLRPLGHLSAALKSFSFQLLESFPGQPG